MGYGNNKISIIGLGYVGLPLAVEFAKKGIQTVGIDLDPIKIEKILKGESYVGTLSSDDISSAVEAGTFIATGDISKVAETDAIIISAPTPLTVHETPDLSFIGQVLQSITEYLRVGHMVILCSSSYPGTTREFVVSLMEKVGLKIGKECHVAFVSGRVDPGNKEYGISNTTILVGGVTKSCTESASELMREIAPSVVQVSSPEVAEMAKLLESNFRNVNVALVNEFSRLCDSIGGIDINEVIEAASTKPFGFMRFEPGAGVGGHSVPIDPHYLSWKAKEYGLNLKLIDRAAKTNIRRPDYVSNKVIRALSETLTPLSECKVLILGVVYKPDVDDIENSPALDIWETLVQRGIKKIEYSDPFITKLHKGKIKQKSLDLTPKVVAKFDCVLITSAHNTFDWKMIFDNARLVIDTCNASSKVRSISIHSQ